MAAAERPEAEGRLPSIERFLGEPTRDLAEWRWLWDGDHRFPIRSHRGLLGRLIVGVKRLFRPLTTVPQADLWERQRTFNLILLEYLQRGDDVRQVVLQSHEPRFAHLEAVWRDGLAEVMDHNDALFARADQKLDRLRRETRELWGRLGSALASAEAEGVTVVAEERTEAGRQELEQLWPGPHGGGGQRVAPYLPRLRGRGEVLELACGRGDGLAELASAGVAARGVAASAASVEECRRRGLRAERVDALAALERAAPSGLGGVVAFELVERLRAEEIDRLLRLAWGALEPGGVLILETPNPLSLVVGARDFWSDPARRRPVHPETLELLYRQAGFDPVERLELRPFASDAGLPELGVEDLDPAARALAYRINELRDRLDDLLFGFQDYALIGVRPV